MSEPTSRTRLELSRVEALPVKRKLTLRLFIGVTITTVVFVAAGAILVNSYLGGRENAQTVMEAGIRGAADHTEREVLDFLEPAERVARMLGRRLESGELAVAREDELERWFFDIVELESSIKAVSYAYGDGAYFMVKRMPGGALETKHLNVEAGRRVSRWKRREPGWPLGEFRREAAVDSYDPRKRAWFADAVRADGFVWSDVYVFFTDQRPGISAAVPVHSEGEVVGVVAVDVGLHTIVEFLAELGISENGIAVIFDQEAHLVSGPNPGDLVVASTDPLQAKFVPKLAADSTIPSVAALAREPAFARALGRGAREVDWVAFDSGDEPHVGGVKTVQIGPERRWLVGVIAPESDFLGAIQRTNRQNLATSAVLLLLAVLLAFVITRWIARSLNLLVVEAAEIRRLRFVDRPAAQTVFREVGDVLDAFADMKTGLRAFQKYLPLKLVRKLLAEAREPTLGGELMQLTVYFSDIAGFTPINENMHPMEMAVRLGKYLAELSEIIEDEQGTVVQYVGDEIMAFWGAPQPVKDHAKRACAATLRNTRRVETLWEGEPGMPVFTTRFGIHTAEVAVGHFGSEERMYYGAIGDGINLTSRLEGANKFYGTKILLSETTHALVDGEYETRYVDKIAVKGKQLPIRIYELLGHKGEVGQGPLEVAREYERALLDYQQGRFREALAVFERLLGGAEADGPSSVMAQRCRSYLDAPPPAEWDGVYVAATK